jgi:hypothetical protein
MLTMYECFQDFVKEGGETGANASLKLAEIALSPTGTPLEQQQATIAEPNADYVRMLQDFVKEGGETG